MSTGASGIALRRQYVKLCDIDDFDDPAVKARIDDIVPGLEPAARLHRKNWEYAMLTLFLEDSGLLREDARILSVGAGHETVLFWLANRVAQVVATDIYGEGTFSAGEADRTMLTDPASFSPYPYRESHLEVRHMDATQLEFPDGSFDVVFTLSSIEHFGSRANIRRAARELGRVLRPGGVAFVATECLVGRSLLGSPAVQEMASHATRGRMFGATRVFTPRSLASEVIEPSGLELAQTLDATFSAESAENAHELNGQGTATSTTGDEYPHIVVRGKRTLGGVALRTQKWTSVGLALTKPGV